MKSNLFKVVALVAATLSAGAIGAQEGPSMAPLASARPTERTLFIPAARWDHRPNGASWSIAAVKALMTHGRPLLETVPRDIADWCPAYTDAGPEQRAAFWVGFLSALSKHESTYRQDAVGGGGKWYGLLQILPATARGYKCTSPSRAALKTGAANLSCGIRILAVTVPRDQVIAHKDRKWRGVAADWGPMRSSQKRADMSEWTRKQSYCRNLSAVRPKPRP